jgi:zinc protease
MTTISRSNAGGRARSTPRRRRGWPVAAWLVGLCLVSTGVAGAQQAPFWPVERPPRPLAPRDVKFPPYDIRALSNGMQIITVLHNEQPAVTMRLLVKAGGAQDPEKKRGVASLVGSLLDQGTTSRSAEQVADQIDSLGGLLGAGASDDFTSVNIVVMKDSFGVAMDLLADIVRNPAFANEEIERQKEQAISSQRVNANDPDYVASVLFDRLVYGFHAYGLPGTGTAETLASVTRQDLQAFHRQYFVPNNMVLAIVGDVTREDAFAAAQRVFGGWARADVPPVRGIEPPPPTRRVIVVDKPDAVQTEIRMGQLAIPRKHADFLPWDLAGKILGGEGANRLHRVLRSERGLTYGASAEVAGRKQAGDLMAETDTRTETTGEALRLMLDEFSRLQRQRVSERELADAQAYLAGSFPLTIETPNDIASHVINNVVYELPVEEISTYRERVLAVTPDDIQRVARAYVAPDRLSVVLVGNVKQFAGQLKAVGFPEFEVIPIDQLDLMSATLRRDAVRVDNESPSAALARLGTIADPIRPRPAYVDAQANPGRAGTPQRPTPEGPRLPVPSRSTAAPDQNAGDLLRRVIEAKGGLETLKGIRTVVAETETTLQLQQGTLPSRTTTYIIYPDRFRVDAEVNGSQTVQVYNAGKAWVKSPAGVQEAPPPMLADFAAGVRRDMIPLLIDAAEGRLSARALPGQKGRDGRMMRVLEISGAGVDRVRLYVDDTMLVAGQAYTRADPTGRQVLSEEVFSDYRVISGVRVPFEAELLQNGQLILKRTLTRVVLNGPVSDTLFAKPN